MVKQYLKFNPLERFGVVSSNLSNVLHYNKNELFLAQYDKVLLFDLKLGKPILEFTTSFESEKLVQVSRLCLNPKDKYKLTVGYSDGSIRIFSFKDKNVSELTQFRGHKSEITVLAYDKLGQRLSSGSKDSQVVVWDVVEEVGLLKLKGHTNTITGLQFISPTSDTSSEGDEYLVSSSKDSQLKLYDLVTGHCLQTVLAHRNEVWSLCQDAQTQFLVSGGTQIKVWKVEFEKLDDINVQDGKVEVLQLVGVLDRSSKGKVTQISFENGRLFVQGDDKYIEVFQLRSSEDIKKKLKRRIKRLNEKNKEIDTSAIDLTSLNLTDQFLPLTQFRVPYKVVSFTIDATNNSNLIVQFNTNLIKSYQLSQDVQQPEFEEKFSLDRLGHRYEIKCGSLSPSLELLLTCSLNQYIVWNLETCAPVRNLQGTEPTSCLFLPGSKHVLVGTKQGTLELFDVHTNSLLETIEAHTDAVTNISLLPTQDGVLTCGLDSEVKLFKFVTKTVHPDPDTSQDLDIVSKNQMVRQLSLHLNSTLQLDEPCLTLTISNDSKFLAVALLDSTVKVFYLDSFKLYLSLYGHKLPVTCIAISTDTHLIVTGSNDKNIKIWGLDFGDCHKSIFAHQEAVNKVQFLKDTHLIVSGAKDGTVKIWDGDIFQQVQQFQQHYGPISGLLTGETPQLFVTVAQDRSIVKFERSDEPIFLEEEKEKELDKLLDANLLEDTQQQVDQEGNQISIPTTVSLKFGERLMEAIDLAVQDLEEGRLHQIAYPNSSQPRQRHPILQLKQVDAEKYVYDQLLLLPTTQLEDCILLMPLSYIHHLIKFMVVWAKKNWSSPLIARVLNFVINLHFQHLTSNKELKEMLIEIKQMLRFNLGVTKDVLGYNLAALQFLKQQINLEDQVDFFPTEADKQVEESIPTLKRGTNSTVKRKTVV